MDIVLWVVAGLALFVAWGARKRSIELEGKVSEARRAANAAASEVTELTSNMETLRNLLGRVAGGHPVDAIMVREGRLYQNTTTAELQQDLDGGGKPYVIDVRTDKEWGTGHIPGAVHLPMDDLEKQLHSVRRDGTKMYMVCAGGGRSASAAKFLSDRGYLNVWNVEGGMKSWRGEVVKD